MIFPEKNSRSETILKAFLRGAMTLYHACEVHGEFPTKKMPDGIEHAKMLFLYRDLVERGCLVREGIKYKLSAHAEQRLKTDAAAPAPPRSIVPPRVRHFLTQSIFVGFSPAFPWRVSL